MAEEGKPGDKEFQTAKRAPIETGISRGTDSVHRQFGYAGTQGNSRESGSGRGRGGFPMRLFHLLSEDLDENAFESSMSRGWGSPHSRRFTPMDTGGFSSGSGWGRPRRDPPYRHLPQEFLRRVFASGMGRGSDNADRRSFPDDFDEDFLFECVIHRLICPLHSGREYFDSEMREERRSTGSINRDVSSRDPPKKVNPPTVSVEAGKSSVNIKKTIPVDGKKIACIFAYDNNPFKPSCACMEDSELILNTFKDLGFKIENGNIEDGMEEDSSSSDEDSDDGYFKRPKKKPNPVKRYDDLIILNQSPGDTVDFLDSLVKKNREASCFLLYFIVKQVYNEFMTEENRKLSLFDIWKQFERTPTPVIILIQAMVKEETNYFSVLLNKDGPEVVRPYSIPRSANVVIGYFPSKGDRQVSVAKIVSEELRSKLEINKVLTNVVNRNNLEDCNLSSKFSSTLIQSFYLAEGIDTVAQVPTSYSRKGKYLGYAFLFSQFDEKLRVSDLTKIRGLDEISLLTLKDLGVELEFCVADGKMTVGEFESKMDEILQSEDLDSCDCIFIIVSSHGCENLSVYAYDGTFHLNYIWQELSKCEKLKNKPKVILTDACRGYYSEGRLYSHEVVSKARVFRSPPVTGISICDVEQNKMSDTLIALATTKGKMAFAGSGGSTFMANLCQMLKAYSSEDFLTILTTTIRKVALLDAQEKQQVTFTSSLRKLLYLPEKKEDVVGQ